MKTQTKKFAMKPLVWLTLIALAPFSKAEQTVNLKVEGIDESALWENVRTYLSRLDNNEADGSERYQYLVVQTVDKGLRALGYYDSTFDFNLTPRQPPQKDLLTLKVGLKKPVRIDQTNVEIYGEAEQDEDFKALLKTVPAKGTILNHATYDNFKSDLERLAQTKGYFDGAFTAHRLEVIPSDFEADWQLAFQSGQRYRYGQIQFRDSQIRQDYLQNILKIKAGDPYLMSDLTKITTDYSSSNWFSSVLVEPNVDHRNKRVDLNLLLTPRKKNVAEVGLGYATDVGMRLQLNWKKPWINNRGHSLETDSYLSQPEQRFQFGYNIPVKSNPLNYYNQISGGIEREDQNDTKSTAAHLALQRFWNHDTGWSFSAGVKARYDSFTQADDTFKTLLVYPTASASRLRSDGKRFPVWGDSQKITVNWGSKLWASDVNFYSVKASSAWIRTFATNHRFYVRGEIGYLKVGEFERLPPALRFFAGGDRSVRGFGYKKISPTTSDGKLVGGTRLATATLEYQYQLYPDWWGAVFYDTGFAANRFSTKELHSGVGAGVRWASPIGAVKLDLATPVRSPNDRKGIQIYLGLGSEL